MLDVVRRYDVDGVHMDDYFYPYPIKDDDGNPVAFPDDASYARYGGDQDLGDWRRSNVDGLVDQLYKRVKDVNLLSKLALVPSVFGGPDTRNPSRASTPTTKSTRMRVFGCTKVGSTTSHLNSTGPWLGVGQSYPKLLEWWIAENRLGRQIWPGNFASRVGGTEQRERDAKNHWGADEILRQIEVTRATDGATGNVLFSMKALFADYGPLGDALVSGPYGQPALVPESPRRIAGERRRLEPDIHRVEANRIAIRSAENPPWLWSFGRKPAIVGVTESCQRVASPTWNVVPGESLAIAGVNRLGAMSEVEFFQAP